MKATTEEAWEFQERLASAGLKDGLCFLDLRRRVEALEQRRAATEKSSAPEPAPAAPPLWKVMRGAYASVRPVDVAVGYAAEIDAVATWLERRYLDRYPGAAELLRIEARRAREGA